MRPSPQQTTSSLPFVRGNRNYQPHRWSASLPTTPLPPRRRPSWLLARQHRRPRTEPRQRVATWCVFAPKRPPRWLWPMLRWRHEPKYAIGRNRQRRLRHSRRRRPRSCWLNASCPSLSRIAMSPDLRANATSTMRPPRSLMPKAKPTPSEPPSTRQHTPPLLPNVPPRREPALWTERRRTSQRPKPARVCSYQPTKSCSLPLPRYASRRYLSAMATRPPANS